MSVTARVLANVAEQSLSDEQIIQACSNTIRAIPPAWPLASSVAVNPFLGQSREPLAMTAARLGRVGGISIVSPRASFRQKLAQGVITDADLEAALAASDDAQRPQNLTALKATLDQGSAPPAGLDTIADLAARATGIDWPALLAERFGAWASAYFDEGQALWAAPRGRNAYEAWRAVTTHDLTLEIAGLTGFARHVADAPESAAAASARASRRLGLCSAALDTYLHTLLFRWGGWAQYARYQHFTAALDGDDDTTVSDLLAIALVYEEALYSVFGKAFEADWQQICDAHAQPVAPDSDVIVDTILQEAVERAGQRRLAQAMLQALSPVRATATERPTMQAAFCIDVRSEVFRRALESVDPGIRTLGFAGFFGLGTAHRRFASDVIEKRLPVLLQPGLQSNAGDQTLDAADRQARFTARARRAWRRFKLAAVSSFAFVEATGPIYVSKLLRDSLHFASREHQPEPMPILVPEPSPQDCIVAAETVLSAMSLTDSFAPLVLLVGHGAHVQNNPHAASLHCGACGGYAGDVNARLLAALLNRSDVRDGLHNRGIDIPADTHFLAALHDTTSDQIQLFDQDPGELNDARTIDSARRWLDQAGTIARTERAQYLPRAVSGADLFRRGRDWAEMRPEWALAGCRTFIAAPRERTRGVDLSGRAFLHDYRWQNDKDFKVLELIMTAPVVVASWISLQYYGSTVAPEAFGAGNKLLHNVTAGIGVVEGNGGTLRVGLPWQSVHDGEQLVHEPLRLTVCIEAPDEAMSEILARHPGIAELFDNRWMHLLAIDADGQLARRYVGQGAWMEN